MVVVRLGAYLFNIPKQQNYVFSKCWVALISCQYGPIGEEWAKYLGRWLNYELAPPVQNRPSTTLKAAVVYFYFGKEFLAVRRCTSPFGKRYKLVFSVRLSALNRRTGDCKHSNGGALFGFRITDLCSRAPILKNQRLILFFPADGEHFISAHVCRGAEKLNCVVIYGIVQTCSILVRHRSTVTHISFLTQRRFCVSEMPDYGVRWIAFPRSGRIRSNSSIIMLFLYAC